MEQGNCTVAGEWLDDSSYQTILRATHMIAFEYDATQKKQRVSPYISEYIMGNYDGRLLSDVMLEDHVIHPDDIEKSLAFREQVISGRLGEMVIRLMTPSGEYRWFRMIMTYRKPKQKHQKLQQKHLIYVGVLEDIQAQMQYHELLRHRAEIDPVTGIYNRETFFERTKKLLQSENNSAHFLICFDIDRFKLVNKLFGNAEGDKVLRHVGDILRELCGSGETFGRLGNDVFAACVGRNQPDTIALVNEVNHRMQDYPLAFRFFLSTGIVPVAPGSREQVNELCDQAVLAQHKIKGNYLYTYSFYDPLMSEMLEREHEIVANIEMGLKEGQFLAYFQPKYDMWSGKIIGAEALARWKHPVMGMISPADFIPVFERNGFIIKLDEYIWEQVCKTIRGWMNRGITPVPVSVNVSRVHLYNKNFCNGIIELCSRYGVPHNLIELEITESAYTECPQELVPVMEVLQQEGFTFSMDDFGSGYSSLNILKDIPVDMVKFDLRFLEDARKGKQVGQSILKNMIQLMKDLKVSILAEGVETKSQVDFLKDVDCHYAQGFYYARPMPIENLEQLLQQ